MKTLPRRGNGSLDIEEIIDQRNELLEACRQALATFESLDGSMYESPVIKAYLRININRAENNK